MTEGRSLAVLPGRLAVTRFDPGAASPEWARGPFVSITRTPEELSVTCAEEALPAGVTAERGFRALRVDGPLAFSEVGVLTSLARPLAEVGVSVFVVSTHDTDWLLVRETDLPRAVAALSAAGHPVRTEP